MKDTRVSLHLTNEYAGDYHPHHRAGGPFCLYEPPCFEMASGHWHGRTVAGFFHSAADGGTIAVSAVPKGSPACRFDRFPGLTDEFHAQLSAFCRSHFDRRGRVAQTAPARGHPCPDGYDPIHLYRWDTYMVAV